MEASTVVSERQRRKCLRPRRISVNQRVRFPHVFSGAGWSVRKPNSGVNTRLLTPLFPVRVPFGERAVKKVLVFSGKRIPPGSLVILAGSSSSDSGGNKRVGALNDKGSCKRFSERAGRNLRERRAGPEIRIMQEPTLLP